ncbi:hypothetical protein Bra5_PD00549 (plasmid) [Rhizobium phaseoli Brasil 5]|nr:hypothetical protein Bra5_PD00549 [Rhizobium phaseoli Brasil 5]
MPAYLSVIPMRNRAARSGRARLMLRLPAVRQRLAAFSASSNDLDEIFEIYELAAVAAERFRRKQVDALVAEYDATCREIEAFISDDLETVD